MKSSLSISNRMDLVHVAVQVSQLASEAITNVYRSSEALVIERKSDKSPVTEADKQASRIIYQGLSAHTPNWPVLSEEEFIPEFSVRSQWPCYWLVDPLDGTKEFIERTGEFTINIALMENNLPTLGVIYLPLENCAYIGVVGEGAWVETAKVKRSIRASRLKHSIDRIRVLTSRHKSQKLDDCLAKLGQSFNTVEQMKAGSALKFCHLAEGKSDIYPRFSPCSEWDTAAGQALLEASGGKLVDTQLKPLKYNQSESLINPHFYALGAPDLEWTDIL